MFSNVITGKFQVVYVHVRDCISHCLALYIAPQSPYHLKNFCMLISPTTATMSNPPEVHVGAEQPPTTTGESATPTGERTFPVPNPHVVTPNSPPGFSEPGPPGFVPEPGAPVSDAQPLQALSSQGSPPKPPAKKPRTGSAPPAQLSRSPAGAAGALVPGSSGGAPLAAPLAVESAGALTPSTSDGAPPAPFRVIPDWSSRPTVLRPTLPVWGPDAGYGFTPRPG